MPTSLTVDDGLLYVLNAGGGGSIVGFTVDHGDLVQLAASARPLSGSATAPAQVSFTPAGEQLVVTERATQRIDLYAVGGDGYATGPTVVDSEGVTPFGFGFDNKGHLVVSEAFGGAPTPARCRRTRSVPARSRRSRHRRRPPRPPRAGSR